VTQAVKYWNDSCQRLARLGAKPTSGGCGTAQTN
jgi:hypothetical protein